MVRTSLALLLGAILLIAGPMPTADPPPARNWKGTILNPDGPDTLWIIQLASAGRKWTGTVLAAGGGAPRITGGRQGGGGTERRRRADPLHAPEPAAVIHVRRQAAQGSEQEHQGIDRQRRPDRSLRAGNDGAYQARRFRAEQGVRRQSSRRRARLQRC